MDKHYFTGLLRKYLRGEATDAERQAVNDYYNLFKNEPDVLNLLSDQSKENLKNLVRNEVWRNIEKHEQSRNRVRSMNNWRIKVAAAAVILIISAVMLFFFDKGTPQKQEVSSLINKQKENHFIKLPDGSKVILSPGSKLEYPSSFDGLSKREVYLEGQAFFDIVKDTAQPFLVHTGKLETQVLGTAFNINAFRNDSNITVTVKRGRVQVREERKVLGVITPAEQIVYNKQEANVIQKVVDPDVYIHWKEEDVFFDNLTVTEAAEFLEEKFNVRISILDESIGSKYFTATFTNKQTLDQALKSICEFNGAVYEYDRENATVMINDKNKMINQR